MLKSIQLIQLFLYIKKPHSSMNLGVVLHLTWIYLQRSDSDNDTRAKIQGKLTWNLLGFFKMHSFLIIYKHVRHEFTASSINISK